MTTPLVRRLIVASVLCVLAWKIGRVSTCFAQDAVNAPEPAAVKIDASGNVVVPPATPEAMRYYRSGNVVWIFSQLIAVAVPLLILFTGLSARMRDLARKIGRKWFFVIGIYFLFYILLDFIVTSPWIWYTEFLRPHEYELSRQSFGQWSGDVLKALALTAVFGFLFLWVFYLLIARSPRRWWLYCGCVAFVLILLMMFIAPIWIAPLFDDFDRMTDKALEEKILALADRAGIGHGRVYEVDKSVDTKQVNAYVSGIGGTQRIVLWDTLLDLLDEDEVLFVMGHEMAHYVLGHVIKTIIVITILLFATLFVIHRTSGNLIKRYKTRLGFDSLADVASLPLILLLAQVFLFVCSPFMMAYSRYHEHEADRFALELMQDNHAGAAAFVKLQTENLVNPWPGPVYKFFRSTHPPIGERITFINTYRPWDTDTPLKYGRYFEERRTTQSDGQSNANGD